MRLVLSSLAIVILSAGPGASQETPKVPKHSIRLMVTGCLKGRLLTTTRTPKVVEEEEPEELDVPVDRFQVAGTKVIRDQVKKHDGTQVTIVGLVKKMDLEEPGFRVPGGRVVISPGRAGDRYGPPPAPARRVILLEAKSVEPVEGRCPTNP